MVLLTPSECAHLFGLFVCMAWKLACHIERRT